MRILKLLYSTYGFIWFVLLFFVFFIPFLIPIFNPKKYQLVGKINRLWARTYFAVLGLPLHIVHDPEISSNEQYIYCPNHFSYFDIPAMGLTQNDVIFVGKSAMEKIPLFGYMYKKLHITVDRKSLKSKYETYQRSLAAIDEGKSLVIFPEGGILAKKPPEMVRFKDGAFRIAIEKQIPIVPVTIVNNWIILPENMLLSWRPLKIVFHKPIKTEGLSLKDSNQLKEQTFNVISQELNQHFK